MEVKPGADFGAFEVVGEMRYPPPGDDDYGCSGVVLRGFVDGEGWVSDVGEVGERLALDEAVGGLGDVFWWAFDLVVGCSVGPDGDGLLGWGDGCDAERARVRSSFRTGIWVAELGELRKSNRTSLPLPSSVAEKRRPPDLLGELGKHTGLSYIGEYSHFLLKHVINPSR